MSFDWQTPPGAAPSRRAAATAKKVVFSLLVGMLSVGVAWAGAGLVPVSDLADGTTSQGTGDGVSPLAAQTPDGGGSTESGLAASLSQLDPGSLVAGASKVSLYPRPEDYKAQFPDAAWNRNEAECEITSGGTAQGDHVADFRVRWPEAKNCLYMGGYGIGPMFSIDEWDEQYGLWSRSVAMSDGTDTVVLTLIDAVYWEAYYNNLCPNEPCGFLDLADQLAAETGLKPESFVFASTHSHTAMDFIGGWGAVPDWYMQQATDSLKASVRQALASMEPAILEAGETIQRNYNSERRDFYRSAEDDTFSWFRLIEADDQPQPSQCTTPPPEPTNSGSGNGYGNAGKQPAPTPTCTEPAPGRAIATVGTYAGHPVTEDGDAGQADADFPAVFAARVEEAFGGVGMFLQTGLGNVSPRSGSYGAQAGSCKDGVDNDGDGSTDSNDYGCENADDDSELAEKEQIGGGLAATIPPIGAGQHIADTDITVGRTTWDQPVTNSALGALGVTGFFDRTMNQTPAAVNVGKGGEENKKCKSASPISVRTSVSAAKIGSLWITGGPGELFSNLTNTIEERNPTGITLALGLVNDGLGYIIQSFETDHAGRQALGFAGKAGPVGLAEYEDAYSIDHCFGDATLEYTIALLNSLK